VASGITQSLVASGMLAPRRVIDPRSPESFLTRDDLRYLKRLAQRERDADTAVVTASAVPTKITALALKRRVDRHRTPVAV
jgi:hypothetical protein